MVVIWISEISELFRRILAGLILERLYFYELPLQIGTSWQLAKSRPSIDTKHDPFAL
jgi:hypothetical protein